MAQVCFKSPFPRWDEIQGLAILFWDVSLFSGISGLLDLCGSQGISRLILNGVGTLTMILLGLYFSTINCFGPSLDKQSGLFKLARCDACIPRVPLGLRIITTLFQSFYRCGLVWNVLGSGLASPETGTSKTLTCISQILSVLKLLCLLT